MPYSRLTLLPALLSSLFYCFLAPSARAQSLPGPTRFEQRITVASIPFRREGAWGLMSPQGKVLVEPRYPKPIKRYFRAPHLWYTTQAGPLPVILLNEQGQELGHFKTFTPAPNGTVVATGRRTITLFDSVGHLLRATPYASIQEQWHEGLAIVKLPDSVLTTKPTSGSYSMQDAKYVLPGLLGLVDAQLREVVPPTFHHIGRYWQGYAPVSMNDRRQGAIDRTGRVTWLSKAHADTIAREYFGGFWAGWSNERQSAAAVDVHDRVVVPFGKYKQITRHQSDPYIAVMQRTRVGAAPNGKWEERWGLLDTTFREITPPLYERLEQHGRWTVVELPPLGPHQIPQRGALYQGRLLIPARSPQVYPTGDQHYSLALEASRDSATHTTVFRYVCYGPQGPTGMAVASLQAPAYLGHGIFSYQSSYETRPQLILASGQKPFDEEITGVSAAYGGRYYQVRTASKTGLLDTTGRWAVPLSTAYDEVLPHQPDSLFTVKKKKLEGLITAQGQVVVPLEYTWVTHGPGRTFVGRKPDGRLVLGRNGRVRANLTDYQAEGKKVYKVDILAPGLALLQWLTEPVTTSTPQKPLAPSTRGMLLVNEKGQQILPAGVTQVGPASDGVLWVSNGTSYAVLDYQGKLLTPFKYTNVQPFSQGITTATTGGQEVWLDCFGKEYTQ
ncbi:WG repeat-containing protein [Hymenobacter psychrophilus]|uniref:WG containing repeat-containing protein n=1 Tax=Hymenobacter psychrophilus TaxID=651662 RepID=A0A1H3MWE8_9BACT|nr:WG repeat-containing protein [Hymenobacter psychrophilus]SDY81037.1 WG containing repeat-containing protein [Hymenobacter psychrophilus]